MKYHTVAVAVLVDFEHFQTECRSIDYKEFLLAQFKQKTDYYIYLYQ